MLALSSSQFDPQRTKARPVRDLKEEKLSFASLSVSIVDWRQTPHESNGKQLP